MNTLIKNYLSGVGACIFIYAPSKRSPIEEYIESLDSPTQKKVLALLKRFVEKGNIFNKEQFRKERGEIWAFKANQARLLCFYYPKAPNKLLVITSCLTKKKNKMPPIELDRADTIRQTILNNEK